MNIKNSCYDDLPLVLFDDVCFRQKQIFCLNIHLPLICWLAYERVHFHVCPHEGDTYQYFISLNRKPVGDEESHPLSF